MGTKSIMSNLKECYICGTTMNLHRHHIFYGTANRRISENQGCWVYLCGVHHNLSKYGVHYNIDLDNNLKKLCQQCWEEVNGKSTEDFIKLFGRNYK